MYFSGGNCLLSPDLETLSNGPMTRQSVTVENDLRYELPAAKPDALSTACASTRLADNFKTVEHAGEARMAFAAGAKTVIARIGSAVSNISGQVPGVVASDGFSVMARLQHFTKPGSSSL
jgi:hypothetical protein